MRDISFFPSSFLILNSSEEGSEMSILFFSVHC